MSLSKQLPTTKSKLELLEHQRVHFSNIKNSITKHSRTLDASDTGTGKTYTTIMLCLELGLIPWVICPKSVVSSWIRVIKQAGFEDKIEAKASVINYDRLVLIDWIDKIR